MEFYFFHLMPYPYLPADFYDRYDSAWVTPPNALFDPPRGTELYNRYLDEMIYAEQLGWDGVCVNEHHQTAYGLMPAPNLMAAILARQTKRVRIAILGNAAPLYDQPLKVAEEVAMIDVISGGRVIAGFVRGVGCEYFSFSESPAFSRERFDEAVALILRAWTENGPFSHHGQHYQFRYVNPWPQPVQKPHPPVFVPSTGSVETLEWRPRRASRSSASTTRWPPCSGCSRTTASAPRGAAGRPARSTSAGWCPSTWARPTRRRRPRPSGTSCTCSAS